MTPKRWLFSAALTIALTLATPLSAAESGTLIPQLEPIRPLLGKTWRGEFKNAKEPTFDVARWERALNGQAVRVLHSVNDGKYGGETIIYWDTAKKQVAFQYFTTAGFQTSGTVTFEDKKFTTIEKVAGNANGITEVRATSEVRPDGTLVTRADYIKDGKVSGGREVTYQEDAKAEVKFK
jgi:hypothetical protein